MSISLRLLRRVCSDFFFCNITSKSDTKSAPSPSLRSTPSSLSESETAGRTLEASSSFSSPSSAPTAFSPSFSSVPNPVSPGIQIQNYISQSVVAGETNKPELRFYIGECIDRSFDIFLIKYIPKQLMKNVF